MNERLVNTKFKKLYLDKVVQEAASQDVLDLHLARAQRIEEEEELSDGRAHVERVERLLKSVQLGTKHFVLP